MAASYAGGWFGATPGYIDGWLGKLTGGGFPTQYAGLRLAGHELCLVTAPHYNPGQGGAIFLNKNGVKYAVYLVPVSDPDASPVRVYTTTGVKAIRHKT